jgi:hypothetical protein
MGLSDLFSRQPKRFVSKQAFETNLETQTAMTPQTLQQLRRYNVALENRRQLEFFFYTNALEKAVALAADKPDPKPKQQPKPKGSGLPRTVAEWHAYQAAKKAARETARRLKRAAKKKPPLARGSNRRANWDRPRTASSSDRQSESSRVIGISIWDCVKVHAQSQ